MSLTRYLPFGGYEHRDGLDWINTHVLCCTCESKATKACDYIDERGRMCNASICGEHAKSVGENKDHCPHHHVVIPGRLRDL